jgi:hypothetical protein
MSFGVGFSHPFSGTHSLTQTFQSEIQHGRIFMINSLKKKLFLSTGFFVLLFWNFCQLDVEPPEIIL